LALGIEALRKRPAVIFLLVGQIRQMLLGWHYMYYYSNSYAMNQYLSPPGYELLALNTAAGSATAALVRSPRAAQVAARLNIRNVLAAGNYLSGRSDVDAKRIDCGRKLRSLSDGPLGGAHPMFAAAWTFTVCIAGADGTMGREEMSPAI